ncbi:hypothetical protein [Candidatus Cryosericum septentrionale]|jgi:hypothetical protein|uniref:Uncharacterized protein n=1 Tax=Candidatus Cryosericum septentrionale TaxID=2290913 RepID=A0A398DPP7_9BACT|nr:hypothetical protein [Candidatus Cryosericum septentrionale]RIE16960.1 hypothetical protein SMC1_03910 [Candidatus Cryosericum septentrionale]
MKEIRENSNSTTYETKKYEEHDILLSRGVVYDFGLPTTEEKAYAEKIRKKIYKIELTDDEVIELRKILAQDIERLENHIEVLKKP